VVNGEQKSSGIEQYRQDRELGTVPGVPLKRLARGTLNASRRKENSPLQCDMLIINPPLKGLNWATQFLMMAYDGACSPNVSIRMA
jgi:hypothetical protein